MRLIDADKMKYSIEKQVELIRLFDNDKLTEYAEIIANGILQELDNVPTADAVEVVRCKDCKYWRDDHTCREHSLVSPMGANEFCSRGERGEQDDETGSD